MSTSKTADESRAEYATRMGLELGPYFYTLSNEVYWVHVLWAEYVELFGTKPSRLELLNKSARFFFHTIEKSLWNDALLNISRITDRPMISGRSNLTIQKLPDLVVPEIRDEVQLLVQKSLKTTEFSRDWRNRHIAHKDLNLALGSKARPLAAASRESVRIALQSISDTMNMIAGHYMNTEIVYSRPVIHSGAKSLLFVLDDGLHEEAAKKQRLRSGKLLPEDCVSRDL